MQGRFYKKIFGASAPPLAQRKIASDRMDDLNSDFNNDHIARVIRAASLVFM